MSNTPIRIGFVGAGQWGVAKHLPAIARLNTTGEFNLELANLLEINDEHRQTIAQNWGFTRSCNSLTAFLADDELDVYVVCINPSRLTDLLPLLASTGKPLFCEKPPGATSAIAQQFATDITQPHLIAFNRRFQPLVQELKSRLADQPIHSFQAHMLRHGRLDSYRNREDASIPPFFKATGIHLIDTLTFLVGDLDIAFSVNLESNPGTTDGRMCVVQSPRGTTGSISFLPTCGRNEELIEIHTPTHSYRLLIYVDGNNTNRLRIFEKGSLVEDITNDESMHPLEVDGFLGEHRAFFRSVESGEPSSSTFTTGLISLRLAEDIEQTIL